MAYWVCEQHELSANDSGLRANIAKNSLVIKQWTPIKLTDSWVDIVAAGETIHWISVTKETFASDNVTVAKKKVVYLPEPNLSNTYTMNIIGWTITVADEGDFFDIVVSGSDANGIAIDGTTESETSGQFQMVKFISATLGIFRVANT